MKWIIRCRIDGVFLLPFCQCLLFLFYILILRGVPYPCIFATDFSLNKCPHFTVGWSGRCRELWMLCAAGTFSVSSQKLSPSDTTSDLLVQLGRTCMPSEFLTCSSGCWCLKILPNTLIPLFDCPWEPLVVCSACLLKPLLDLGHAKSYKHKPAVINLFAKFHARYRNLKLGWQWSAASCCVSSQGCSHNCLLEFLETGRMTAKCYFVK